MWHCFAKLNHHLQMSQCYSGFQLLRFSCRVSYVLFFSRGINPNPNSIHILCIFSVQNTSSLVNILINGPGSSGIFFFFFLMVPITSGPQALSQCFRCCYKFPLTVVLRPVLYILVKGIFFFFFFPECFEVNYWKYLHNTLTDFIL